MFKLNKHFQILSFLLRISLLGVFLFTSTFSFAFDCSDHSLISVEHNSESHTISNVVKDNTSHDTNDHDE